MSRWFLGWVLVTGCAPSSDGDGEGSPTGATTATGPNERELGTKTALNGTCDYNTYWPAATTHFPISAARLKAPKVPYEVKSIKAAVYGWAAGAVGGDRDCSSSVPVEVFFFVDDNVTLVRYKADIAGTLPELPTLATAVVQGQGGGADFAPEFLEVVLDPPVLVEEEGAIWAGFRMLGEGQENACPTGCQTTSEHESSQAFQFEGGYFGVPGDLWGGNGVDIPDIRLVVDVL